MKSDPPQDAKNKRPASATRDHLANERTLLAWSRTAIAVMALGFVVARFGLLIREISVRRISSTGLPSGVSTDFGIGLVGCGSLVLVLSLLQYVRAGRQIERDAFRWAPALSIGMTVVLAAAGLLLIVYLLLTA